MKKSISVIIFAVCLAFCTVAHAENGNGYIVKLKDSMISLMSVADGITHIDDNLYRADDMDSVNDFIPAEYIETIFPDYELELFDTDYPQVTSDEYYGSQWYLDAIGISYAREKGLSGKNVKIAIIDSGISTTNPDMDYSGIIRGYNCIANAENPNDYNDVVGHGTMVAGLIGAITDNELGIAGMADGAEIIPIKVTEKNTLSLSNLFSGVAKALETDCDIINMSLGGAIPDANARATLKEYMDQAEEKGIIVVAAAGNSAHVNNVLNYPAGFDNVIGVGAVDENSAVTYFSQKNNSVFVTAPGINIISLYKGNSLYTESGTSLSAPIVTATAALIKEVKPGYTGRDIKNVFMNTSVDAGKEGYDTSYGYGILNIENIVEFIQDDIPDYIVLYGSKNSRKRIHIHNNSKSSTETNLIFSSYGEDCSAKDILIYPKINISSGVTTVYNNEPWDRFFLWDKNLRPFFKQ